MSGVGDDAEQSVEQRQQVIEQARLKFDCCLPPEQQFSLLGVSQQSVDQLLVHCVDIGASDILIQGNDAVWVEVYGRWRKVVLRELSKAEVLGIAVVLYGTNAAGKESSGEDADPSYSIHVSRERTQSFRVNITPCLVGMVHTSQISMRPIPGRPPLRSTMNLPREIEDALVPENGLVLIVGVTGSGKSTLLASNVQHIMQHVPDKKVITCEDPIEYTYIGVEGVITPKPAQSEVGRHIKDFVRFLRGGLRRKPSIIMIGEARDRDTMEVMLEAALTGHTVYATVHAESVAEAVSRIVSAFPADLQPFVMGRLLSCLKLVVVQKLVKSADGKRIAAREWLRVDRDTKYALEAADPKSLSREIRTLVSAREQDMETQIRMLYDAGLITEEVYRNEVWI